jgi:plasmid segregation protein ParM
MKTIDFKTKTEFIDRPSPCPDGNYVLGLDIGYSAVKGMSPNKIFCFPAYARKLSANATNLKADEPTDIYYRDESGEWAVGSLAYNEVNANEVMDSETELYGRNRYFSQMFQVISRTGIAIGLMENSYGNSMGKKLSVQTGLPPKYENDEEVLKEVLSGTHTFEIKVGLGKWKKFSYSLSTDDIYIMPQPLGALISSSISKEGRQLPIIREYFSKNLIILDPGFGTMDDYSVHKGRVSNYETFPDLAMREVFRRTCADIKSVFGVEVTVPDLQNHLDSGEVKKITRVPFSSKKFSFAEILEKAKKDVCLDMLEKMKSVHNYFADIDYIIVTGGTYDAWKDIILDTFKDMDDLKIIPANINDESLTNVFSNVRGYYYQRCGILRKK